MALSIALTGSALRELLVLAAFGQRTAQHEEHAGPLGQPLAGHSAGGRPARMARAPPLPSRFARALVL